jgi:hypothetical protein
MPYLLSKKEKGKRNLGNREWQSVGYGEYEIIG